LTRRTYDAELALDITAETFARAYESRRKFRGRTDDDLEAWLFGIARNVLARFIRRGVVERRCLERLGVEVPTMTPDEITRVNELAGLSNLRRAVAEEFAALADDQRYALQLRVIDELDYREVARRLDVPEATARARVSRGLKTLANALDHRQLSKEIPL
jgi:RNA polymerase sigma factor (sigma-70 family)